jgi:Anti-sigma factor NepR
VDIDPGTQSNPRQILPGRASEHTMYMESKDNSRKSDPEWARGLKRLYDSVVEEPLPDVFKDLLAKLDKNEPT